MIRASKSALDLPRIKLLCRISILATTLAVFAAWAEESLPKGKGADLTYAQCRPCHEMSVLTDSTGISRALWEQVLKDMERLGMRLPEAEYSVILDYLATYLGPNPPPAGTAAHEPESAEEQTGSELYKTFCSSCHGKDGRGLEQAPPLAGNPHLLEDPLYNVLVVLYGLTGPIKVGDREFEGVMPGFSRLSHAEIAKISEHVLTAWGNARRLPADFGSIRPEQVKQARKKALAPAEVARYRPNVK